MTFKTTKVCCYVGYMVQALVINFAPLLFVIFQNTYKISYALLGAIVFMNFTTQLVLDVVMVFFLEKLGYRRSAVLSQFACTIGFVLLGILPDLINPYLGICISTFIYSLGAGLIEVVINPIIAGIPKEYEGNFVLTHSFYSWGQLAVVLITTVLLKVFGTESWQIISMLWAIVPFINALIFIKTPITPPEKKEKSKNASLFFGEKTFLILLFMMICAGGSEVAMCQWASTFAQNALGVDKIVGDLLGPCMFAVFMGIGRVIYGIYNDKLNYHRYMLASCLLCVICYIAAALSKNPYISLGGCALCGFAVSTLWPGVIEVAARRFPDGGGPMYSSIAIFGDVGCSVAPFLTGLVASMSLWGENALRMGLVMNIIYPLGFIAALISIKRTRSN